MGRYGASNPALWQTTLKNVRRENGQCSVGNMLIYHDGHDEYDASSTRCCHARIHAFLLLFLTEPERAFPPAAQAKKPPGAGFFLGLWEGPLPPGVITCTGGGGGGPPPPPGAGGGGGGIMPGLKGGTMTTCGSSRILGTLCLLLDFFPAFRRPGGEGMFMK